MWTIIHPNTLSCHSAGVGIGFGGGAGEAGSTGDTMLAINRENILLLLIGLVVGAAATAGYMEKKQAQGREVFEHKNRCLQVAQRYEKEHTDPPYASVTMPQVEYSPERNSCVAEVIQNSSLTGLEIYLVVDLLSSEEAFIGMCDRHKDECNVTFAAEMSSKQEAQFTKFIHTRSP
jgi:hypothetical protein